MLIIAELYEKTVSLYSVEFIHEMLSDNTIYSMVHSYNRIFPLYTGKSFTDIVRSNLENRKWKDD